MVKALRLFLWGAVFVLGAISGAAQPLANFSASTSSGCYPLTVNLTNLSTGGAGSWYWDFGNGATSTLQNPTATYLNPGTYTVTLVAASPSGTDTETKVNYITIYAPPQYSFSAAATAGCPGFSTRFGANVTANSYGQLSYVWDFGDGTPNSTLDSPTHIYATPGNYTVSLTLRNGPGCDTTISRAGYITVYTPPSGSFAANQAMFCTATPVTAAFTNNSTGFAPITASWHFGDGGTSSANAPLHTYNNGGLFTVSMVATDGHGCTDSVVKTNYIGVYDAPVTFAGPINSCFGDTITFLNTTPNASRSLWDFGDGSRKDTAYNPQHVYLLAGTYTVSLTTDVGPCTKTLAKQVTVHARPATTISYYPQLPCPAPDTITYTAATSNSSTVKYEWDFLDSTSTVIGNSISRIYYTNGYKSVKLTVTDTVTGCAVTTATIDIPINQLIARIVPDPPNASGCVPFSPTFVLALTGSLPKPPPGSALPPYPVPAVLWNWTFPKGIPGSSTNSFPSSTWNTVITDTVHLSGLTANGCPFQAYAIVHADTPVLSDFTAAPLTPCVNTPVTFRATVKNVPGLTYEWLTGEGTGPGIDSVSIYYYTTTGKKAPALITNHFGCDHFFEKPDYIDVKSPDAKFRYTFECAPDLTVHFTDLSEGANKWHWDFNDGTSDTVQNPTHTYAHTGTYYVLLTTYNSTYGCSDTELVKVRVVTSTLGVTANQTSFCADQIVELLGSFEGPRPYIMCGWQFDQDTPATYYVNPLLLWSSSKTGYHDIKFIVVSGDATGTCYDTLTIDSALFVSRPNVHFATLPPIGCAPLQLTLVDSSSPVPGTHIVSRAWAFGLSPRFVATATTFTHNYPSPGTDSIKLFIKDDVGCYDSLQKFISIRKTVANFIVPDTVVCIGEDLSFTNLSTGYTGLTYRWDFGDGTFDTAANPVHHWDTAGFYTVKLSARDSTPCFDSVIRTRLIKVPAPKAAFTMDKNFAACRPLVVHFTNGSSGASQYSWDMGTGSSPIPVTNPVTTYTNPGKYIVTLTAKDTYGCVDSAKDTVYLLGYPGAFSYARTDACLGEQIQFNAIVTGVPSIQWDFGDGNVVTTGTPFATHTYTNAGTFTPSVIFSSGPGCSSSSAGLVPIQIDEVRSDFTTSVPCIGVPFTLTQSSSALFDNPNSWVWLFSPSKDTAAGPSASYQYNSSGNHSITLISTNSWGCTDTIVKNVFINPLPIIDAGPADTGICPGDTILLTGHGGATYEWSSPTAPISCSLCTTTRAWTAAPTTYYLKGTDSNGCINTDSITARIQIKTTAEVKPGGAVCIGETFRLQASGATIYHWSPAAFLDSPDISAPLARPIITTHYVVEAQEGTCLIHYDTVVVEVHPSPFFDAGHDQVINYGASVMLDPTRGGISRIEWRPDTTLSCLDCFDPVAHPLSSTLYYAKGYSEYGCVDSDSVFVRVRCNGDSVFIPNTFTPNGDGLNEVFYPRGKGIAYVSTFRIFNRWGELVFERSNFPLNDEANGWDGTYKGKQLSPDVYMYTISSRCTNGEIIEWKGDVTLVR